LDNDESFDHADEPEGDHYYCDEDHGHVCGIPPNNVVLLKRRGFWSLLIRTPRMWLMYYRISKSIRWATAMVLCAFRCRYS
jgi:hypothetical protein